MKTYKDKSGRIYSVDDINGGTVRRVSPERPWRGKSERRLVLKQRKLEREGRL